MWRVDVLRRDEHGHQVTGTGVARDAGAEAPWAMAGRAACRRGRRPMRRHRAAVSAGSASGGYQVQLARKRRPAHTAPSSPCWRCDSWTSPAESTNEIPTPRARGAAKTWIVCIEGAQARPPSSSAVAGGKCVPGGTANSRAPAGTAPARGMTVRCWLPRNAAQAVVRRPGIVSADGAWRCLGVKRGKHASRMGRRLRDESFDPPLPCDMPISPIGPREQFSSSFFQEPAIGAAPT